MASVLHPDSPLPQNVKQTKSTLAPAYACTLHPAAIAIAYCLHKGNRANRDASHVHARGRWRQTTATSQRTRAPGALLRMSGSNSIFPKYVPANSNDGARNRTHRGQTP